jgi:hypothetical protein
VRSIQLKLEKSVGAKYSVEVREKCWCKVIKNSVEVREKCWCEVFKYSVEVRRVD